MPMGKWIDESRRIMGICNACRYCEGFCAVFPAMERRRTFTDADLVYLSNLCHNCRGCYYACQYAPPHEFAVNVPQSLAELRLETYRQFARPAIAAGVFRRNGRTVALIALLCTLVAVGLTVFLQGPAVVFAPHSGENAFYRVIPYAAMVAGFSILALGALALLVGGGARFWHGTGGRPAELGSMRAHRRALWDTLRLKYLDGGGHGCNYPGERFSMARRRFHHLVFYGFSLCLASTTTAAVYDHFLGLPAPYPFFSWPVLLGTAGGTALLLGTAGLLYLKGRMDPAPAAADGLGLDVGFLVLLLLSSLSGLALLLLRETPAMGILLAVHLGLVAGLFISLPYGKFVHAVYRYAALVRNALEQDRAP